MYRGYQSDAPLFHIASTFRHFALKTVLLSLVYAGKITENFFPYHFLCRFVLLVKTLLLLLYMSTVKITTTQNIELEYDLASLGERLVGRILDGLVIGAYI